MINDIGFDVLSDLRLEPNDSFKWGNKPSSLYCLLPGNVSSDTRVIVQTLSHLAKFYQGVFYIPGQLEYETAPFGIKHRSAELHEIASQIPKVMLLDQYVVIIDGIAIVGVNGWSEGGKETTIFEMTKTEMRLEDTYYLNNSIQKLQRHLDIKNIIILTNDVPDPYLYYGEDPDIVNYQIPLVEALQYDTENKVSHWVFGNYNKLVDAMVGSRRYVNNPYVRGSPYWAKRISISL